MVMQPHLASFLSAALASSPATHRVQNRPLASPHRFLIISFHTFSCHGCCCWWRLWCWYRWLRQWCSSMEQSRRTLMLAGKVDTLSNSSWDIRSDISVLRCFRVELPVFMYVSTVTEANGVGWVVRWMTNGIKPVFQKSLFTRYQCLKIWWPVTTHCVYKHSAVLHFSAVVCIYFTTSLWKISCDFFQVLLYYLSALHVILLNEISFKETYVYIWNECSFAVCVVLRYWKLFFTLMRLLLLFPVADGQEKAYSSSACRQNTTSAWGQCCHRNSNTELIGSVNLLCSRWTWKFNVTQRDQLWIGRLGTCLLSRSCN